MTLQVSCTDLQGRLGVYIRCRFIGDSSPRRTLAMHMKEQARNLGERKRVIDDQIYNRCGTG